MTEEKKWSAVHLPTYKPAPRPKPERAGDEHRAEHHLQRLGEREVERVHVLALNQH